MGGFLGRLGSGIGGALALSLVVVPMTGPAEAAPSASVSAPSQGRPGLASAEFAGRQNAFAPGLSLITTARAVEPYLVREANGTLNLKVPVNLVNRLPASDVQTLQAGLTVLNGKISTGQLRTTEAGSVFDPTADSLKLQGGWTGYGRSWWGYYFCLNHNDINRMTNFGWWAISGAGIAAISLFSATAAVAITIFIGLYGGWMYLADRGNGSCLNGSWAGGALWVTSQ